MALLNKLKALDAYPKVNEDFFTKTLSGGVITLVAGITMFILFVSELRLFLTMKTVHELSVDVSRGETIEINFDVTFPKMPCSWLSLDAMDVSGEFQLDVDHDVYKRRLDEDGKPITEHAVEEHAVGPETDLSMMHKEEEMEAGGDPSSKCGDCYGATSETIKCCNTCDELQAAYRAKGWAMRNMESMEQCKREGYLVTIREQQGEGCQLFGSLVVNKVAGNFHFAPGKSFQHAGAHVHDLMPFPTQNFDLSHVINQLSFGKPYPGMTNPLDSAKADQHSMPGNVHHTTGMFQYFLKVVPTVYTTISNSTIRTNQFSVTEHFKAADGSGGASLPGVFFFYDLSPIKVRFQEETSSWMYFITSVCAIVGGVFTVSGIVDGFVFHSQRLIQKKMELGKFN